MIELLFNEEQKVKQITLILLMFINGAYADDRAKVIYGEDNREDIMKVKNWHHTYLAESTAAMIHKNKFVEEGGNFVVMGQLLKDKLKLCSGERFENQTTAATCSGFLVGPNILVTAGHCAEVSNFCEDFKWAFNFYHKRDGEPVKISKSDIFHCKKIIHKVKNNSSKTDFAIIELDREVRLVKPLELRQDNETPLGAPLVVIGNPTGLPTKVSDGAFVRDNSHPQFLVTNLDTFGGNSGSAVFNDETGLVEGILVRGERDYVYDSVTKCYRPKYCSMSECRGEDVQKIYSVLKHIP